MQKIDPVIQELIQCITVAKKWTQLFKNLFNALQWQNIDPVIQKLIQCITVAS